MIEGVDIGSIVAGELVSVVITIYVVQEILRRRDSKRKVEATRVAYAVIFDNATRILERILPEKYQVPTSDILEIRNSSVKIRIDIAAEDDWSKLLTGVIENMKEHGFEVSVEDLHIIGRCRARLQEMMFGVGAWLPEGVASCVLDIMEAARTLEEGDDMGTERGTMFIYGPLNNEASLYFGLLVGSLQARAFVRGLTNGRTTVRRKLEEYREVAQYNVV